MNIYNFLEDIKNYRVSLKDINKEFEQRKLNPSPKLF